MGVELPWLVGVTRAKKPQRLPVVLSREEAQSLLEALPANVSGLIARVLYGAGLRLMEAVRLRVKDVDFSRGEIVVRDGKGGKDQVTMLPENLIAPLQDQLARAKKLHDEDLAAGYGEVWLTGRAGGRIPQGRQGLGLAVCISVADARHGSPLGRGAAPSHLAGYGAEGGQARGVARRYRQAVHAARAAAFVCDPSVAGRLRYPPGAGAAGPRGRQHDDDLHPRAEPGWAGRAQSVGCTLSRRGLPRPLLPQGEGRSRA